MKKWLLFTPTSNSLRFLPPGTRLHNTLASERPVRFSDIFKRPFEVDEKAMTLMASQLDNQISRDCGDNHSQTFSFSFTAL